MQGADGLLSMNPTSGHKYTSPKIAVGGHCRMRCKDFQTFEPLVCFYIFFMGYILLYRAGVIAARSV